MSTDILLALASCRFPTAGAAVHKGAPGSDAVVPRPRAPLCAGFARGGNCQKRAQMGSAIFYALARGSQRGTVSGAGGLGSLGKEGCLGEFSVFRKVRSELSRPLLDLLDPVKHLSIAYKIHRGDTDPNQKHKVSVIHSPKSPKSRRRRRRRRRHHLIVKGAVRGSGAPERCHRVEAIEVS